MGVLKLIKESLSQNVARFKKEQAYKRAAASESRRRAQAAYYKALAKEEERYAEVKAKEEIKAKEKKLKESFKQKEKGPTKNWRGVGINIEPYFKKEDTLFKGYIQ